MQAKAKKKAKPTLPQWPAPGENRIVSDNETAAHIGVHLATVRRMDARGELPQAVQISANRTGRWSQEVDAALESRRRPPGKIGRPPRDRKDKPLSPAEQPVAE